MTRIILNGCMGAMGSVITDLCSKDDNIRIVAGIDSRGSKERSYPIYSSLSDVKEEADVLVDFSTAAAMDSLFKAEEEKLIPMVICTTGLSDAQLEKLNGLSQKTAILKSANMSLGINILLKLVKEAAAVLSSRGFDIEIVEKHHHRKLDAPSGTALALADCANTAMDNKYHYVYDRSERHEARDPKEIGISCVRAGSIVGDHDVIFAGTDEVITLSHTAYSRAIFAKGALSAAEFLAGKGPGMYDMSDVIA